MINHLPFTSSQKMNDRINHPFTLFIGVFLFFIGLISYANSQTVNFKGYPTEVYILETNAYTANFQGSFSVNSGLITLNTLNIGNMPMIINYKIKLIV